MRICGTRWRWCSKESKNAGRNVPHRCAKTRYAARDHDHVCEYCGEVRKAKQ